MKVSEHKLQSHQMRMLPGFLKHSETELQRSDVSYQAEYFVWKKNSLTRRNIIPCTEVQCVFLLKLHCKHVVSAYGTQEMLKIPWQIQIPEVI